MQCFSRRNVDRKAVVELTRSFPKWHRHQDEGGKNYRKPDKIKVHVALAMRQRRRDQVIKQLRHTCQQSWEIRQKEAINPRTDPVLAVVFCAVGLGSWCFSFRASDRMRQVTRPRSLVFTLRQVLLQPTQSSQPNQSVKVRAAGVTFQLPSEGRRGRT